MKISISFFLKENKKRQKQKNTQHAYRKKIKTTMQSMLEALMAMMMVERSGGS